MNKKTNERKYFFLPVNTGYVDEGLPNDRCVKFYADRSGHNLYCAIVGNVVIPNGFGSNDFCAKISDSISWQRLSKAITIEGARPGIQLSSAWENYNGIKHFVAKYVNNPNPITEYKAALLDISSIDVLKIFENLRRGIELSVRAGFKHIQIHAAHGYLFSLLIDEAFSPHSELALDNLNRLAEELVIEGIESSLRISLITGDQSVDENRLKLIDVIFTFPFSFFDVSFGFYNINKYLIYPTSEMLLASRLDLTLDLAKRFPNKQVILSGKSNGAWNPLIPNNVHIGICRDLIANPNFLRDRAMGCIDCMKCHYYSRGESQLTCGRW
ncbi:MAG: hypothetical protein LHW64_09560 [Candidatus Cloacimonetes bacterium]|nr:hypothetical protein [Candidatus Cloacimonadota bacterium]MDY0230360.1 hypothetical protein [Candidatus Cloacimonadaceae bacterium]